MRWGVKSGKSELSWYSDKQLASFNGLQQRAIFLKREREQVMEIFVDKSGTPSTLKETLEDALNTGKAKSLLVLSCDGNDFAPERLNPILKNIPVPIFGGIFPMVMSGKDQMTRGSVVVAIDRESVV